MIPDPADLAERLEACHAAAVHDVLRAMGLTGFVLPPEIRCLDPARRLAGQVWTVSGRCEEGLDAHQSLLSWTGLLSMAPAGRVVVCQPNTHDIALMGELSAETLHHRGVRGWVVDGGCRDTGFILELGFPVWCSFTTPKDIVGRWRPERFGEPVTIGEVTVCSGDWLLADRDGAVIIPGEMVAEVAARTEAVLHTENTVRPAILAGMDPREAYLGVGAF